MTSRELAPKQSHIEAAGTGKHELIQAAGDVSQLIRKRIEAALREVQTANGLPADVTESGTAGVWKLVAFVKTTLTRVQESITVGDDIFGLLHGDILKMGSILQQLHAHFEHEAHLKKHLEALMTAIETPETPESRAEALATLLGLVSSQADELLGANVFEQETTFTEGDTERRWAQIKQILPVIITGITAELTIVQAFNRIYQDARLFYPVLHKARSTALTTAQLGRLSTETATLQIAAFNVTVGHITAAVALTEQALQTAAQLDSVLTALNPVHGMTNLQILEDVERRTAELQLMLTEGTASTQETPKEAPNV